MLVKGATKEQIVKALEDTNLVFDNNIIFKRYPEFTGFTRDKQEKYRFTLTVKSSKDSGARRSHSGRRIAAACWHVHSTFFECLFELAPSATVVVAGNKTITAQYGNWEDRNIGSLYQPLYYSEACDCE